MDCKMEILMLVLCVAPVIVSSITITSNGNSPEVKLKGGMMVDLHNGFVPITSKFEESTVRNTIEKAKTRGGDNSTKLSINERYRRLIPYMTFYYANDLATPTTSSSLDVEVEKAQIVQELHQMDTRQPKKIIYSNRNIPRYQGNRLTQHNIASANPTKFYYKNPPVYQIQNKVTQNYNPLSEYKVLFANDYDSGRFIPKQTQKTPSIIFGTSTRKPFLNFYNDETPNIRYYLSEKDQAPKYKLVPYEQTPPIRVASQNENVYDIPKKPIPVSVLIPKEQIYIKPRPARPQYVFENVNIEPTPFRKQPAIVSESYYEKQQSASPLAQPVVHSGFQPIFNAPKFTTEATFYTSSKPDTIVPHIDQQDVDIESAPQIPTSDFRPNYYQYVIEQTSTYRPQTVTTSNTISLASLLDSLQLNKSIPKPITKENVGSSIRTLLQVLTALKAVPQENDVAQVPVLSKPKPFVAPKVVVPIPMKPAAPTVEPPTHVHSEDLHEEPYLAHVNTPSQHLDDNPSDGGSSQRFPPPVTSDDEGGTPGQPGVDYPILTTIPQTSFNCKTQRYKGFFADTETRCQVWHYCDLNGGQASFLCPNGTIFSQAALTCDWWFNVRCASTTQLYVINESLYKYILPHSPKFPEDYSGPLVDKYLTLKFKEMEEQFKKNKNKQAASDKMDSGEDESSEGADGKESSSENTESEDMSQDGGVSEASVIVESPGTSGKVERLEE